ncbi:MAG: lipopolysaccharide assembly protein LapA domain-containing protein, partial [Burkholderiaceae bacterium]|nr:lipopolysaccharide assembly protein LapA domain-containing protein [Burkholderiaceae bacterium]
MKVIAWLLRLLFFLLVLWFALKNTTPVPVRITERIVWDGVPLIVVMLACLLIGALAMAAALAPRLMRLRRQAQRTQRTVSTAAPTTMPSATTPDRLADAAR